MPPDGQDPQCRKRKQPHERPTRGPDRLVDPVSEHGGHQAHELLRRTPGGVHRRKAGARHGADPTGTQRARPRAAPRRPPGGQAPEALERGQRPADAEHGQEHRAHAQQVPQARADLGAPTAGDRQPQQGESEEQPDHEGADADELLARLAVHVMRRSAYTGTTPKRSTRAANATSSPRSASASWRAASEPSSASGHPANSSISATEARAASLRASLRMPLRMALMRRPAV